MARIFDAELWLLGSVVDSRAFYDPAMVAMGPTPQVRESAPCVGELQMFNARRDPRRTLFYRASHGYPCSRILAMMYKRMA